MVEDSSSSQSLEFHKIQTEDGYILTLMRVKSPTEWQRQSANNGQVSLELVKPPRQAALIVHGFMSSGEHWFISSKPEKSLPQMLTDAGYDCWVCNLRGSPMSKDHAHLSTSSKEFWDFSWFEMGCFDIPATINYILETTGTGSLSYIGHSMGSTIIFLTILMKPEYCEKVQVMVALAPAAYGHFQTNAAVNFTNTLGTFLGGFSQVYKREIPSSPILAYVLKFCPSFLNPGTIASWLFKRLYIETLPTFSKDQIEEDLIGRVVEKWPASTSMKVWCHGATNLTSGDITHFDYGKKVNLKRYGQHSPPILDLRMVNIPVAIFYSDSDKICPVEDVLELPKELPYVIGMHKIHCKSFAHGDFLFGKDASTLVYQRVIEVIQQSGNKAEAIELAKGCLNT